MIPNHSVGSQCGRGMQIVTSCVALECAVADSRQGPTMQINYLLNTAMLETSGPHCIYLCSCGVARKLCFVCHRTQNNGGLSAQHLVH